MIDLTKILDTYERKARLYPALLLLCPFMLASFSYFPDQIQSWNALIALLLSLGILAFLSQLARDRGKVLEPKLFSNWGGMPSVTIFRYADSRLTILTKQKYHDYLSQIIGINSPTSEEEKNELSKADKIYSAWSDFLRNNTRDTTIFPLVFKENINYGYRRNLLGLRYFCLIFGLISILAVASHLWLSLKAESIIPSIDIPILAFLCIYILIFIFWVTPKWVKIAADAYAQRLIESSEKLYETHIAKKADTSKEQ
ncbi:MAG: hypothetical protein CV087_22065 [Candidatus Brocadia sp. WS118]|nr:MAG: hypothetical protein CV087_22065 [Candidatus Brocadia sp. WS118]